MVMQEHLDLMENQVYHTEAGKERKETAVARGTLYSVVKEREVLQALQDTKERAETQVLERQATQVCLDDAVDHY